MKTRRTAFPVRERNPASDGVVGMDQSTSIRPRQSKQKRGSSDYPGTLPKRRKGDIGIKESSAASREAYPSGTRRSARQVGIPANAVESPPPAAMPTNDLAGSDATVLVEQEPCPYHSNQSSLSKALLDREDEQDRHQSMQYPREDLEQTMLDVLHASAENLLEFFSKCSACQLLELAEKVPCPPLNDGLNMRLAHFNQLKQIYKPQEGYFARQIRGDLSARKARILCTANIVTAVSSLVLRDLDAISYAVEHAEDIFCGLETISSFSSQAFAANLELHLSILEWSNAHLSKFQFQEAMKDFVARTEDTEIVEEVRWMLDTSCTDEEARLMRSPWRRLTRLLRQELHFLSHIDARAGGDAESSPGIPDLTGSEDAEEEDDDDFETRARLAAQAAMRESVSEDGEGSAQAQTNSYHPFHTNFQPSHARQTRRGRPRPMSDHDNNNTDCCSSIRERYEKAKQEAAARIPPRKRAVPPPKRDRRKWSTEEEKALMHGLDRVHGPHWSDILLMYGENGTVSDVLKERTQIQLKDKARNLKLFFLKTGIEVPTYLKPVTGELRTRAPVKARKQDKRKSLVDSGEMDKITDDALAALAGASQSVMDPHRASIGLGGKNRQPEMEETIARRSSNRSSREDGVEDEACRDDTDDKLPTMQLVGQALDATKQLETHFGSSEAAHHQIVRHERSSVAA